MLGLRRKVEPAQPDPKPYDYVEEERLIAAGDLKGWKRHVLDRPGFHTTTEIMIHIADCVSRINDARKEADNG